MKLLETPDLQRLSDLISTTSADNNITCRLENYSCKMTGFDKKIYKQVNAEGPVDELEALAPSWTDKGEVLGLSVSPSPHGMLCDATNRKTLYYLRATLTESFSPDYDFSSARSSEFSREPNLELIKRTINSNFLASIGEQFNSIAQPLWAAIGREITPSDCDLYSYTPDANSDDPFVEEGCLWSFCFFFYNRKLKRILLFSCQAKNPSASDTSDDDRESEELPFDFDESPMSRLSNE